MLRIDQTRALSLLVAATGSLGRRSINESMPLAGAGRGDQRPAPVLRSAQPQVLRHGRTGLQLARPLTEHAASVD